MVIWNMVIKFGAWLLGTLLLNLEHGYLKHGNMEHCPTPDAWQRTIKI